MVVIKLTILEDVNNKKDRTYTVYVHKFPNGKVYVGASRQKPIIKRWRNGGGYKNQKQMYAAIKEFGWDNIDHIIIKEDLCEKDAQDLEKKLIKEFNSQNPEYGYNVKNGGQVFDEHSEEFLESLQKRMVGNTYCVGRKLSQKHIEALKNSHKNIHYVRQLGVYKHSDETKKIISDKAKERWKDPEYRERCAKTRRDMSGANNPMYGAKHSEDAKKKMRQKATGRKVSNEVIEKLKASFSKGVIQYDLNMNYVAEFSSCKEAGLSLGGNGTNVGFCCRNPHKTYKGFYWRFSGKDGKHFQKEEGVSE